MAASEPIMPKPSSCFRSLPSTPLGRGSAWLLAVSIILVLVNNLALMPWTERVGSLDVAQSAFSLTVFLCSVAAGATGLVAVISKRERSGIVFLAILLLAFALAMNVAEMLG